MSAVFQRRRRPDMAFLLPLLALLLVGLMLVSSSTLGGVRGDLVARQALAMAIGLLALFALFALDYRFLLKFSFVIYLVSLLPLAYLLLFGRVIAHVRSWIRVGSFQFQPAEFARIATAMLVAYLFETEQEQRLHGRGLARLLVIVLVPFGMVALQPDLGEALTFLPLIAAGMFFGRADRKYWITIFAILAVTGAAGWFLLRGYQKQRIETFLHPAADVSGTGYQLQQSKIAVGSGQLFGKGYRRGTQSQLRFLPVRHTDFIFAVLAEEWGFLGVLIVLSLYAAVVLRGLWMAGHARDRGGTFLVLGLISCFGFSAIVNTGMMIGIFPTTGIPLPLLSYGGSAVVATLMAMGLILSVEARRFANA